MSKFLKTIAWILGSIAIAVVASEAPEEVDHYLNKTPNKLLVLAGIGALTGIASYGMMQIEPTAIKAVKKLTSRH